MAIRRRVQVPERTMSIEALIKRRQLEGHKAVTISWCGDRWQVSMQRPDKGNAFACEVGQVGEPLNNVLHNMLVVKAFDRINWTGETETNPTPETKNPVQPKLKLRRR